ncbi:hypothetical protein Tco_0570187 [Tanacetum coccineum]
MVVTVAAVCCKPTVSIVGVAYRAMLGYQRGSFVGHMFTRLRREPLSMVCSSLPSPNSEQSPAVARPDSIGHALDSCRGHNGTSDEAGGDEAGGAKAGGTGAGGARAGSARTGGAGVGGAGAGGAGFGGACGTP